MAGFADLRAWAASSCFILGVALACALLVACAAAPSAPSQTHTEGVQLVRAEAVRAGWCRPISCVPQAGPPGGGSREKTPT